MSRVTDCHKHVSPNSSVCHNGRRRPSTTPRPRTRSSTNSSASAFEHSHFTPPPPFLSFSLYVNEQRANGLPKAGSTDTTSALCTVGQGGREEACGARDRLKWLLCMLMMPRSPCRNLTVLRKDVSRLGVKGQGFTLALEVTLQVFRTDTVVTDNLLCSRAISRVTI